MPSFLFKEPGDAGANGFGREFTALFLEVGIDLEKIAGRKGGKRSGKGLSFPCLDEAKKAAIGGVFGNFRPKEGDFAVDNGFPGPKVFVEVLLDRAFP